MEEENEQSGYSSEAVKGRCPMDASWFVVGATVSAKVGRYEGS